MLIIDSFPVAVAMCVVTMLCWGSWANMQKLAGRAWPFQLYYWDYSLGVLLLAVLSAFTCGSLGTAGRPFLADLAQADRSAVWSAFLGGAIFNLSNILLVAAIVVFSAGLFLSSFLWNTLVMVRPFQGEPVAVREYFAGSPWVHFVGILGGVIWNIGMSLSILASDKAGPAVSYGLGQGATMVAAFWGVFVWREFASAPAGTGRLLALMFVLYGAGLTLLIAAR